MKEIDQIVKMLKILLQLRAKGLNEAADLIVKQHKQIQSLKKESK
jgi:hypothetical protein